MIQRLKDKPEHYSSKQWVRINYKTLSASADGFYIMKREVYEDNRKKFEKLFRDCLIEIIYDYPVTMYDICESALRELETRLYTLRWKLSRMEKNFDESYVNTRLEYNNTLYKIIRLERKLLWEN